MNCNTTHYRANSSSVPGDPTKVSRVTNRYHRDSYADIAGYAGLAEQLKDRSAEEVVDLDWDEDLEAEAQGWFSLLSHLNTPVVPRVWESLYDIPEYVVVSDEGGWEWVKKSGLFYYTSPAERHGIASSMQIENTHSRFHKFTEVVS